MEEATETTMWDPFGWEKNWDYNWFLICTDALSNQLYLQTVFNGVVLRKYYAYVFGCVLKLPREV